MTGFEPRLVERASRVGLTPTDAEVSQLSVYFDLLVRWNRRINLTALPLDGVQDTTLDRLFIEPMAAAEWFPTHAVNWFDLGTGGGSPAVPLKILRPASSLTMVESRGRKAAFLREVIRELALPAARVVGERLETIAPLERGTADLVSVRAVRVDGKLAAACRMVLNSRGRMLLFQSTPVGSAQLMAGFALIREAELADGSATLAVFEAQAVYLPP
jgi:16S rRNA (guanine527-N7)-methyltransferase